MKDKFPFPRVSYFQSQSDYIYGAASVRNESGNMILMTHEKGLLKKSL